MVADRGVLDLVGDEEFEVGLDAAETSGVVGCLVGDVVGVGVGCEKRGVGWDGCGVEGPGSGEGKAFCEG